MERHCPTCIKAFENYKLRLEAEGGHMSDTSPRCAYLASVADLLEYDRRRRKLTGYLLQSHTLLPIHIINSSERLRIIQQSVQLAVERKCPNFHF